MRTSEPALPADRAFRFGRYHFHPRQGLTRDGRRVSVTPKSLDVLQALLERAGEIVTKEEIFRSVWRDSVVGDATLTSCIKELRRALRDNARSPQYIETHHRRGFRFIASPAQHEAVRQPVPGLFVGRDAQLEQLSAALSRARAGTKQIVFVTGEAGIGKTALLDVFFAGIPQEDSVLAARAQCVEHYGAGEAYHPLLEALGKLCRQVRGAASIACLRRYAPCWLAQLPSLQTARQLAALERRTAGLPPGRMLRELSDALEAIAASIPVVLCIEDLHWSDASTLDWILSFAHRQDRASLLLIATVRSGAGHGSVRSAQALADNIRVRGLATELALARLDPVAVTEYVERRFVANETASAAMRELARLVHQRSEGNPLFIVNILSDLIARNVLCLQEEHWVMPDALDAITSAIPADVRGSIEQQIDRLPAFDRELLEVASVLPMSCPAAAVAAGAGVSVEEVEATLGLLARGATFLRNAGEVVWPDRTASAAFEFLHALYREVLHERLSAGRRAKLHQAIGARLEAGYGSRAAEIAAELAIHFECARDYPRAITYLQHAAEADQCRNAHAGAQRHFLHALSLLDRLPRSVERDGREIGLHLGLGGVLMQLHGWAAAGVEQAYLRARELSDRHGLHEQLFAATWNLWVCSIACGSVNKASELADTLFALASASADSSELLQAHHARWTTCFALGDFRGVELHTDAAMRLPDRSHGGLRSFGSHDAGVCARVFRARVAALCGQEGTAVEFADRAITAARELDHPFTLAFALMHSSAVQLEIDKLTLAREHAEQAIAIAREHGFSLMLAWATCFRGSSLAECGHVDEGLELMREAIAEARALRSEMFQPHLLSLMAKAQLKSTRVADARLSVEEAFAAAERNGERTYTAELQRLKAEVTLATCKDRESLALAEAELRQSLQTARQQGAQSLARRASSSLSSLMQ